MKYFLILWVCSAVNGSCLQPPIRDYQLFNTHYECVNVGYSKSLKMVQTMKREVVEKNRLFVAFNCKLERIV